MNKIKLINLTIDNKGHYGLGASSSPFDKDFPLYLRITDIDDNSYVSYLPTCVDPKQYPDYNNHLLKNNDIVFARTGNSTGRNYFYDGKFKNVVFAGFLIKYSLDPKKVNPKYVSYYCQSQEYKSTIDALSNGSTRKNLNANQFGRIEIPLYSIETQQHIVNIIGSIDNLIESNTVALNSIESLINNIFHAHYILWKEKKELGKVFTCILGGTPSTKNVEYWDGNIPWINSGEVNNLRISTPTKYITKLGLEKSATKLLPTGTTVIAITGATLGQVSLLEIDSCANQSVIGILENKEYKRDYIYPLMNKIIKELILNQTGGAQQHINKNDVQSFIINIPNIQQYEEYTKIVLPLLNHQSMIVKQNNKLTNLKQKYLNKFFD